MEISIKHQDQTCIILLSGTLCTVEVNRVKETVIPLANKEQLKGIIIDFTDVNAIDSAGIGLIVQFHKFFSKHQKRVIITTLSNSVREVFSITKLDRILTLMENSEKALMVFA